MKVVIGTSNEPLSKAICEKLNMEPCKCQISRFNDSEIFVEIKENVRGEDIFIIQSTSSPANDNLMELLIINDALRRASAKTITAVVPYFGYARQDRKMTSRVPITAKLIANILTQSGVNRLITADLHAGQIQGFFDIPLDNLMIIPLFYADIKRKFNDEIKNITIVSPDAGGVTRARMLAEYLNVPLAIVDKRRLAPGESQVMNVIGKIKGRICIIIDDIIDSGGTMINAAEALKNNSAKQVHAYVSHGVLTGNAIENIGKSQFDSVTITDSILNDAEKLRKYNILILSIAKLIAKTLKKVDSSESVSSIFDVTKSAEIY